MQVVIPIQMLTKAPVHHLRVRTGFITERVPAKNIHDIAANKMRLELRNCIVDAGTSTSAS